MLLCHQNPYSSFLNCFRFISMADNRAFAEGTYELLLWRRSTTFRAEFAVRRMSIGYPIDQPPIWRSSESTSQWDHPFLRLLRMRPVGSSNIWSRRTPNRFDISGQLPFSRRTTSRATSVVLCPFGMGSERRNQRPSPCHSGTKK